MIRRPALASHSLPEPAVGQLDPVLASGGLIVGQEGRRPLVELARRQHDGYVAALAAYRDGHAWLEDLLRYLEANRDFTVDYVRRHLPGVTTTTPEGTYLAWLDCRQAGPAAADPFTFFLERAKVAFNDGALFGPGGQGFVRLNFGTPRQVLTEGLERMRRALGA